MKPTDFLMTTCIAIGELKVKFYDLISKINEFPINADISANSAWSVATLVKDAISYADLILKAFEEINYKIFPSPTQDIMNSFIADKNKLLEKMKHLQEIKFDRLSHELKQFWERPERL